MRANPFRCFGLPTLRPELFEDAVVRDGLANHGGSPLGVESMVPRVRKRKSWIKTVPDCLECGDTGWRPSGGGVVRCGCGGSVKRGQWVYTDLLSTGAPGLRDVWTRVLGGTRQLDRPIDYPG